MPRSGDYNGYRMGSGLRLEEGDIAKKFGAMEIGVRGVDGRPAEVVGLGCCVGAFIEVTFESYGCARVVFHAHEVEGYCYGEIPGEYSLKLLKWTGAARGEALNAVYLCIREQGGVVAIHATTYVCCADAVELEVIVGSRAFGGHKKFHAGVFVHIRIVLVVYGAEIVASHEEVNIDVGA